MTAAEQIALIEEEITASEARIAEYPHREAKIRRRIAEMRITQEWIAEHPEDYLVRKATWAAVQDTIFESREHRAETAAKMAARGF